MDIERCFISPNYDERYNGIIDFVIIHYTEMTFQGALDRLCDPVAKVSAHYLIKEDGQIFQLVDDSKRAWHAGNSYWNGYDGLNDRSIGIELDNDGIEPFSESQIESCIKLCKYLKEKYAIERNNIIGHSDIAPDRKIDPGQFFPWKLLSKYGLGIDIPTESKLGSKKLHNSPIEIQKALSKIGYKIYATGEFDEQTNFAIRAFLLHFYQNGITSNRELREQSTKYNLSDEALAMLSLISSSTNSQIF